ncbi:MAG: polysaccharide pyruvyl transferase family protein, partial [Anaeroplasmataceae bacterium]|nr:polysaccharide pyruvyl transferase family protein [Anaeroplasmataceae bacterium]
DLDRQVLKPVNYTTFEEEWKRQHGGNAGNKLFTSAVEQYLTKPDITYSYYTGVEAIEDINEKYDIAILPLANIFNPHPAIAKLLEDYTKIIEQFKIPIYILGCGLQCAGYEEIDSLINTIGISVAKFLDAIYQTGGELALRGYATKEFLDKIMPNSAVVTGCPSIYQKGPDLQITNLKVKEENFRPVINGNLKYLRGINSLSVFEQYKNSMYLDQDEFAQWLYFKKLSLREKNIWSLVRKKTYYGVYLLAENRVKLLYDIPYWIEYLQKEGFSFSCGSRIHGNIAAILAGVPAMVLYRDARTRELAEFLELPCCVSLNGKPLYEAYLKADYSCFNRNFRSKYERFEEFMVSHGISYDLNDRTLFEQKLAKWPWGQPEITGKENIECLKKKFRKNADKYQQYDRILELLRRRA